MAASALGGAGLMAVPFVACGALKIAYDPALYGLFRRVRLPEEARRA